MLQEKQDSDDKCEINDAELFISSIAGSRDASVSFQYFDDKKQGRVKPGHCHGTLAENFDYLSSINSRGAGIYMMVNAGDLDGRGEENITAVRCVFVDLDGSNVDPARQAFLKPHLITKTSTDNSGREHYQVFWRINPISVNDANRLKIKAGYSLIQNTLAEQFGGDKKITEDLCRVMRLPGFYHMKGHPQLCSIIEANDHPSFDYTDVIKAFDVKPAQAADPHLAQKNDFTEGQITEGDRNAHCFTYACQKVKQGLNEDEVYACLITENAMRCVPPLEDDEVESIVKSAMKYRRKHSLSGKRFEPSVYVSEILLRNHVINLYGEYYRYQDGVYRAWNDTEIKGLVWNWSNRTASVAQIESTVKLLAIETYVNPDAVNPLGCLNLRSGILNAETGELAAHDPKRIFTIQIPVLSARWPTPPQRNGRLPWCAPSTSSAAVENDGAVADALVAELLHGGIEKEVGLAKDGARVALASVPASPPSGGRPIEPGTVFVVSGGARGVTAAALIELARASRPRFVLLGRTPLEDEPAEFRGVSGDADLKRVAFARAKAAGAAATPQTISATVERVVAARNPGDARETCRRRVRGPLRDRRRSQLGCPDPDPRRDWREWGPIRGLVHGAGVLSDALLGKKTDAQFDRVFDTKVLGLRGLLDATREGSDRLDVPVLVGGGALGQRWPGRLRDGQRSAQQSGRRRGAAERRRLPRGVDRLGAMGGRHGHAVPAQAL